MGGFLESQQKKTVCLICSLERIIIHLEPDVPAWQSTAKKKVTTEPFTT